MKVLLVSKDIGNVVNGGAPVARVFQQRGHEVGYVLDADGRAWMSYNESSTTQIQLALHGLSARSSLGGALRATIASADAVLVTLSGSGPPNAECDATAVALELGKPVYGIEEMFGGRRVPGFEDLARRFKRLFTIIPMDDDGEYPVCVVGPLGAERYRDVPVAIMGAQARCKLGLSLSTPLVYWTGHPRPESPHVLSRVCEAVVALRQRVLEITLVVARHSRDKDIPYNSAVHRSCLVLASARGVRVIENSLDHKDFSADHEEGILEQFRPVEFATYKELLCACVDHGVIVSGFGTDAAVIAPYLGVPSVLFIDEHRFLLGRALQEEKKIERLPLASLRQVSTVEQLVALFADLLVKLHLRQEHCGVLQRLCPLPERNPAELVVETVLKDVGVL